MITHIRKAMPEDLDSIYLMGIDVWSDGSTEKEYLSECRSSPKYKKGEWFVLVDSQDNPISSLITYMLAENTIGIGIFDNKQFLGYSIIEVLSGGYSICHFSKADIHIHDIYDFLMKESCKILRSQNCSFLNYEQDLGLPGLRYTKRSFRPINFFKKLIVCSSK